MIPRTHHLAAGLALLVACNGDGASDDPVLDVAASPAARADTVAADADTAPQDTVGRGAQPDTAAGDTATADAATADATPPPDASAPDAADAADAAPEDAAAAPQLPDLPAGAVVPKTPASWVTDMEREPRNLHMAWQQDPARTMTVTWATTDASMVGATPRLWVAPKALTAGEGDDIVMPMLPGMVFEGAGLVYAEMFNGVPLAGEYVAWHVEATGLEPDTEYVYRVGSWGAFDEATGAFTAPDLSPPRTFRTARPKGDRTPMRFVLAGDSRGGMEAISAQADRLGAIDATIWFFNGDFTASGMQWEFDEWWQAMAPIVERRPLMGVQGNHELFADLFYAQLAFPSYGDVPVEYERHAWSLDIANVHFVGLDSNTEEAVADLVPWLDADLAAARKDADIDWVVVMAHHPPFSASNHGSTPRLQEHWLPLFDAHEVDVVFTGHDHNYERTHRIRDGQVVEEGGVVYVVAGGFFSPPYSNGNEWWTATSTHGDKANYVEVVVEGKRFEATAWSGDGAEVLDSFVLEK